jgi:hypothetical protein
MAVCERSRVRGDPTIRTSDRGRKKTPRPCDHSHSGATIANLNARLEQGGKRESIRWDRQCQEAGAGPSDSARWSILTGCGWTKASTGQLFGSAP